MNRNMQILIKDIKVEAIIGCYDYERKEEQPVIIDLVLNLGAWHFEDALQKTIDYAEVSHLVKEWVAASHFFLLESLAQKLAQKLLANYQSIKEVIITVSKPKACQDKNCTIQVKYSETRQYKIALALGSNLNNPRQQLVTAIELLHEIVSDIKLAPFYKTAPFGFKDQEDFYNTCISGYTKLSPQELLVAIKKIEKLMGKAEQFTNGPRIIDIDIVLFADLIYKELFLQIPHPRMQERDFVLQPLSVIEPDWQHPGLQLTIAELLVKLTFKEQFILQEID